MIKPILFTIIFSTFLSANVKVCVSIAPQAFFVQKIAGELAQTTVLVPSGASPATYAPKPAQLRSIKNASVYFTIGVPFEKNWLERFTSINDELKLIDTTKDIQKIFMQKKRGHHDEDGHKGHNHGAFDPHVWLSPELVIKQSKVIMQTLSQEDPTNKALYEKNYQSFVSEIHAVNKKVTAKLQNLQNRKFIVFHPSFGYFAKAFGLTQVAIEKEGKEPSLRYIKEVIDFANKNDIKTIFVAPQFSQKSAQYIAEHINGTVKKIDPLSREWDTNLLEIAKSFEKAN